MVQHGRHGFYAVIHKIGLAAPFLFAKDGLSYNGIIILRHIGLDRMAVGRRCSNSDHVPHAGKTHMESAGNRRSRQGEHIDSAGPGFPFFLLYHAEALLFIHHQKPQFSALYLLVEYRMGADNHINIAVL